MQTLLVAVLALGATLAATLGATLAAPPPGTDPVAAPWAAYISKTAKGRSLVGLGEGAGPASPFLKPPFTKPTFMPPVVDPSKFIGMKTDLLNSLFPAAPAAPSLSERAMLSPFAFPADPAPAAAVKPPPPAFLADLFKALNINKTVANASEPAAYPAAYPAAPAFPASPFAVDPGVFISKKAKFLSDLFASLATPAPPTLPPTPEPALNAELAATLQRLLDSLNQTPTAQDDIPEDEAEETPFSKGKRAADPAYPVSDAKDKVVATIIAELSDIKNNMVGAVTDLALAQQAADAAAAAAAPKKPVSPYAAMWAKPGATAAPTKPPLAVEPVRQKVVLLGQVFDMLTDMEQNISSSMTITTTESPEAGSASSPPDFVTAFKTKINQMMAQTNASSPSNGTGTTSSSPKSVRLAGPAPPAFAASGPAVDPTFWIPDSVAVGPEAYLAKTKEFLANIMAAKSTPSPVARRSYKPYQQQDEKLQLPQFTPQQQQQQAQGPQEQKAQPVNPQTFPEVPVAYQLQRHHHHHNRQPYWWN